MVNYPKLIKRLRRLAKDLETPPTRPPLTARITVISLGETDDPTVTKIVTTFAVYVAQGEAYECELPVLGPKSRIQVQVIG